MIIARRHVECPGCQGELWIVRLRRGGPTQYQHAIGGAPINYFGPTPQDRKGHYTCATQPDELDEAPKEGT